MFKDLHIGQRLHEQESLHHEYKEFCLKSGVQNHYDTKQLKQIITTGILPENFNDIIEKNIKQYFNYYIPKYASAYSNCSDIKEGYLSIGINDYGEITGIPYIGEIDKKLIDIWFKDAIKNIRGVDSCQLIKRSFVKNMKVSLLCLQMDNASIMLDDVSQDILENLRIERMAYDAKYIKYLDQREIWLNNLSEYICNINAIVTSKKLEIIAFVRNNTPSQFRSNILTRLMDPTPITSDDLEKGRNNIDHFMYWVFQFKDSTINKLMTSKPRPPNIPKIFNAPIALMSQLSDLRLKFIKNNLGIKYYLLCIKFPGNTMSEHYLEYFHPTKQRWETRKRTINSLNEPCCI